MARHRSAGMRSRCAHLRAAYADTPISSASTAGDGHNAITARKDENRRDTIRRNLGQFGQKCKRVLSVDWTRAGINNAAMNENKKAFWQSFCARVKLARERRDLSQKDVATVLDIAQGLYKHYEIRSPMPHHLIPKFCLLCGVSIDWLYTGRNPGFGPQPAANNDSPRKLKRPGGKHPPPNRTIRT
jgi:ribosome-binding protein aMBF1 (putative translation factor)